MLRLFFFQNCGEFVGAPGLSMLMHDSHLYWRKTMNRCYSAENTSDAKEGGRPEEIMESAALTPIKSCAL
jgi:hypothetical protein